MNSSETNIQNIVVEHSQCISGIRVTPESCGIFPEISGETPESPESLYTDHENFANYTGVDDDETAEREIKAHLQKGHLKSFSSLDELRSFLGEEPILNKIGLIVKSKNGKTKTRMILDTKVSNLKACSRKAQRVLLPRLLDAIVQGLENYSKCEQDESLDWFVLDFSEAFWQVPLEPSERRFFCCKLVIDGEDKYIVFLRTVQGSRGAPLSWARLAALIMRLTQGLFDPARVRLHCFVDDPISSIRGLAWQRQVIATVMMLTWEAVGFHLAYQKGQLGQQVDWIGGNLQVTPSGIVARVKDSIVQDIRDDLDYFTGLNVIPIKRMRTFVGRANHAAGLLLLLRPFLHAIWGALFAEGSAAPTNTIWSKQVSHALAWLDTFFKTEPKQLTRTFTLEEYGNHGPVWEIGTDASPWGLGGWLACNGTITRYFACAVGQEDLDLYEIQRGSCNGQQTLEGLAILVAMRLWGNHEDARKVRLVVRGDNVGALMLLIKMRPSSPQQAIIARELALITVRTAFPPRVVHTPGIAHKLADSLSRMHDPGHRSDALQHPALAGAARDEVPARPRAWYRALDVPVRSSR